MGQTDYEHAYVTSPRLSIPWKGKIIRASLEQLKDFKGNLNKMLSIVGGDEPNELEKSFRKIRIVWDKCGYWCTPYQLLMAEGDVRQVIDTSKSSPHSPRKHYFRTERQWVPKVGLSNTH